MQLGMIGLGRMGANMVRRLLKGGRECVVFNRSPDKVQELTKEGAVGAFSLADLVSKLLLLDSGRAIAGIRGWRYAASVGAEWRGVVLCGSRR